MPFYQAIRKRGMTFRDVCEKAGFTLEDVVSLIKSGKQVNWNFYIGSINILKSLHDDEKEEYREMMLSNATKIFKRFLDKAKKKKNIKNEYIPKVSDLREFGYRLFEKNIIEKGISIDDVWERAGFNKPARNNWNILIGSINRLESLPNDEKEEYRELMLSNSVEIYKHITEDIIQKKETKNEKIDDEYFPNYSDLIEFDYSSFYNSIISRGIFQSTNTTNKT